MLGHVSGGKPHLAAALPVWAPRMVLAVADILEEAAHADPAPVRRANGGGRLSSALLQLRPFGKRLRPILPVKTADAGIPPRPLRGRVILVVCPPLISNHPGTRGLRGSARRRSSRRSAEQPHSLNRGCPNSATRPTASYAFSPIGRTSCAPASTSRSSCRTTSPSAWPVITLPSPRSCLPT